MARLIRGNTIYVDEQGVATTDRVKVVGLIFTPNSNGDTVTLSETSNIATKKLKLKAGTETLTVDLSSNPLRFESGVYVESISNGATCTIITSGRGADV